MTAYVYSYELKIGETSKTGLVTASRADVARNKVPGSAGKNDKRVTVKRLGIA